MNMQLTFSLADIGWLVIWALVSVILIYLVLILSRLYASLKIVNKLVAENRDNIDKILDEVPGISKSVNEITDEIAHGTQAFRGTVDNIASSSESVTGAINENNTIVDSISSFLHGATMVKSAYNKFAGNDKSAKEPILNDDDN
jgi:uncharacterized protein YoxC